MEKIKTFQEFINETYLEKTVDPKVLKYDKKKMKKNGYIEVSLLKDIDGLKKGDKVLVTATEIGQLEDESLITCYKNDKEIIVPKKDLKIDI